jgi:glycerophosphoryl diester phosphodiesterase
MGATPHMQHRTWPHPRIIGHRGGGTLAPENTLAAIRKAAELGFGGVEFDVMLSSDGVPVLIHDETLERTTNGRGSVAATPYAKLASLDAGAWFGPEHRGEPLPTLEQAGRLCIELGLWANIEIKPASGFERETAIVAAKLVAELWAGASRKPLLSSFHGTCLEMARAAVPEFERGYLTDRIEPGSREAARRLGCVSVHCNCAHLTKAQADQIKRAGFGLLCYTVNETDLARRLFSWGVDAIFTDRLDRIPPEFA